MLQLQAPAQVQVLSRVIKLFYQHSYVHVCAAWPCQPERKKPLSVTGCQILLLTEEELRLKLYSVKDFVKAEEYCFVDGLFLLLCLQHWQAV